jgi:predicted Co/Zn/Cd cation transporter (cation efflux family)
MLQFTTNLTGGGQSRRGGMDLNGILIRRLPMILQSFIDIAASPRWSKRMKNTLISGASRGEDMLKSWTMILLTLAFIFFYGFGLFGGFTHLIDDRMISHLEPVIFVFIGYFFGRLPARQNENALKEEVCRQARKAEAAQHAKEQIQQIRESLEEKMKNARITLASSANARTANNPAGKTGEAASSPKELELNQAIATALNILNS